jgi:hypothetical protein
MMAVAMGLGPCLLLRPGKLSFILSLIMYAILLCIFEKSPCFYGGKKAQKQGFKHTAP